MQRSQRPRRLSIVCEPGPRNALNGSTSLSGQTEESVKIIRFDVEDRRTWVTWRPMGKMNSSFCSNTYISDYVRHHFFKIPARDLTKTDSRRLWRSRSLPASSQKDLSGTKHSPSLTSVCLAFHLAQNPALRYSKASAIPRAEATTYEAKLSGCRMAGKIVSRAFW
jgi:hypothetical protein